MTKSKSDAAIYWVVSAVIISCCAGVLCKAQVYGWLTFGLFIFTTAIWHLLEDNS